MIKKALCFALVAALLSGCAKPGLDITSPINDTTIVTIGDEETTTAIDETEADTESDTENDTEAESEVATEPDTENNTEVDTEPDTESSTEGSTEKPTKEPEKETEKESVKEPELVEDSLKTLNSNELKHVVNTASKYSSAYSNNEKVAGRTALYFYHPRKLVLDNSSSKVAFWTSSNANVVRVYSDGIVEAMSEGVADITAYGADGKAIQTFYLYATTSADSGDVLKSTQNVNSYSNIRYHEAQEKINTIMDYAYWLYKNDVYYAEFAEGSNPAPVYTENGFWMQPANADWIFKNAGGICCTVASGGVYALVGDYEENGLIYLSGPYGHVISYFKENGQYIVVDFTNNISGGTGEIIDNYNGDAKRYMQDNIGTGSTLKDAFNDFVKKMGEGNFLMKNYIIYAINLTGLDYYPAECNNWSSGKDFFQGVNRLYVSEGTPYEVLYLAQGVQFEIVSLKRSDIPTNMEVWQPATDVSSTDTSMLLIEVPVLKANSKKTSISYKIDSTLTGTAQNALLQVIKTTSATTSSYSANISGRTQAILFQSKQLVLTDKTAKIAFWYSSNPNVIRVSSDGKIIPYSEGIADVYAFNSNGKVLQKFSFYVTTAADKNPLGATQNSYKDIYYEDTVEKLSTITDYVSWLYENGAFYHSDREPKGNGYNWTHNNEACQWLQMANSNWMFKDYAGICCNVAAGSLYALAGDYEEYGLVFMSGYYGHVINYYKENGTYYVIDFTNVISGGIDISQYDNSIEKYVKSAVGEGKTLKEAFENICEKNGGFYYENYIIYGMDLSGLNYYPAECNNWCNSPVEDMLKRNNILFVSKRTEIIPIYTHEKAKFSWIEVNTADIPKTMQIVLSNRMSS